MGSLKKLNNWRPMWSQHKLVELFFVRQKKNAESGIYLRFSIESAWNLERCHAKMRCDWTLSNVNCVLNLVLWHMTAWHFFPAVCRHPLQSTRNKLKKYSISERFSTFVSPLLQLLASEILFSWSWLCLWFIREGMRLNNKPKRRNSQRTYLHIENGCGRWIKYFNNLENSDNWRE